MALESRTISTVEELVRTTEWSNYRTTLGRDVSDYVVWRAANRDTIEIKEQSNFEIDGGFVSLYGNAFHLVDCKDFKLTRMTIRLGEKDISKYHFNERLGRPSPLGLEKCRRGTVTACHFAWGMDENLSVKSSKDIRIEHCILSEPLDNPWDLPPEKEGEHAFNALFRGSEVILERCLFVGGRNRSPSVSAKGKYCPDLDMRYCVIHDFKDIGSKYNAGDECPEQHRYRIRDCYYVFDGDASHPSDPIKTIVIDEPEDGELRLISNRNRLYEWTGSDARDRTANAYWGKDGEKIQPGTKDGVKYSREKGQPKVPIHAIIEAAGTGRMEDEIFKEDAANHRFHPSYIDSEEESLVWSYYRNA